MKVGWVTAASPLHEIQEGTTVRHALRETRISTLHSPCRTWK
ncbi:Hypothetical protein CAP_1013 [Chondromyces apiculatus DSM 436]|uniref:Uncharacterized protein n=1 Tax=Chondromyces apiculatus DSM 436 TaxID=1192034 RepID=A0A017TDW9_9BACT|nr:Hypothetical protein CAP_1013 [Chondromyces apiculatus DSM 436]